MKNSYLIKNSHHAQSGAALIVSLILLSILTILAVSASQTTRIQERMAGNTRDAAMAFQAAEASVRNAEKYLAGLTIQPNPCLAAPCAVFQTNALPLDLANQSDTWWSNTGVGTEYGVVGVKEMTAAIEDPQYAIEEATTVWDDITEGNGPKSGKVFYRTTGRSKGTTENAIAVIQTTYVRRY